MNTINPYGSSILNGLFGQNTNVTSVQSAQIIDAPTSLKNLATNLILKGEVVAQRAGREAIIATDRGEVTVRLKNDLPVGSKVDIQIPSGQQAKEVIIQPTLAKAIQQNQQAQVQAQQPQTSQPPVQVQVQAQKTSQTATIADVKNLQATATQATQNITNTLSTFNIGQAVRITPLPPAQQNGLVLQSFTQNAPLPVTIQSTITSIPSPNILPQIISPQSLQQKSTVPIISNGVITTQRLAQMQPTPLITSTASSLQISGQVLQPTQQSTQSQLPLISNPQPQSQTPIIEITPVRVRLGAPLVINPGATIAQSVTAPSGQIVPKTIITTTQATPPLQSDARLTSLTTPAVQMNSGATQSNIIAQPPLLLTNGQVSAGQIVATATGFVNADGNPIIQTVGANNQIQLSTLHYPAKNLPAGTQIILNPTGSGVTQTAGSSQSWQNMIQFVNEMASVFPALTPQSLMSLIPNTAQPKSFPAAALLFLAAAKGGDLSGWLGTKIIRPNDNGQMISKKTIDLLIRDVASQSGRTAIPSDPPMVQANSDWRGHILPLILGADIHQATFWAKDDGQNQSQDDDNKKIGGTRFVVDLKLSRMGDVYFDGLIHPKKQTFDLALITEREISEPMQNTIKSIWHTTLGGLGLDGIITFKDTA